MEIWCGNDLAYTCQHSNNNKDPRIHPKEPLQELPQHKSFTGVKIDRCMESLSLTSHSLVINMATNLDEKK